MWSGSDACFARVCVWLSRRVPTVDLPALPVVCSGEVTIEGPRGEASVCVDAAATRTLDYGRPHPCHRADLQERRKGAMSAADLQALPVGFPGPDGGSPPHHDPATINEMIARNKFLEG